MKIRIYEFKAYFAVLTAALLLLHYNSAEPKVMAIARAAELTAAQVALSPVDANSWGGADDQGRYAIVKQGVPYAPPTLAEFTPHGYRLQFNNSPRQQVRIFRRFLFWDIAEVTY